MRLACIKHENKIIVGSFVNIPPVFVIFVIIGAAANNGIDQKERKTDRQTLTHTHRERQRETKSACKHSQGNSKEKDSTCDKTIGIALIVIDIQYFKLGNCNICVRQKILFMNKMKWYKIWPIPNG
jgi:hypothetical protein